MKKTISTWCMGLFGFKLVACPICRGRCYHGKAISCNTCNNTGRVYMKPMEGRK